MSQSKFYDGLIEEEILNLEDVVNLDEEDNIFKVSKEVFKGVEVHETKVNESGANEGG